MQKKIVYLDRDGVINKDFGYVYEISKFEFCDGVFEACNHFINLGYEIIIITNQSGIGRDYYTKNDFLNLTEYMKDEFKKHGINILKVYYCPHSPEEDCDCRKPNIGMILQSLNDFNINLQNSWLIGDKISDIECGKNAKIPNRILISNKEKNSEDFLTANSLFETINLIKK
ncbi:D-glycero-beta-D-manno-heptose 1,7-bisphosphate 7-phosphatase [Aliarcobacter lanthieri]|uniref:D-glycero-beta-D-manno-heptose 1,7-bisphosphate 7-phosphatase n=1 Tax=Aliarcobacter lanthieri TaxID=1355374 RepID=UPI0004A6C753|nr:D-glycero-beta-D-manno-heptose 1,7-bisphosphate 7-phosphatase [Aliarcobacter lanthieri]QKF59837.1 D,D-heptose 1,7-bisphosphate phosphatase [Aliarcobacter lanthieri]